MRFFVLSGKRIAKIIFASILIVAVCVAIVLPLKFEKTKFVYAVPNSKFTVVVDAGHGGVDGGCVGKTTKVFESDLNLKYALNIANQLKNLGINVVLTRSDANGLYEKGAKNLKKSDMLARKNVIDTSGANLVVSVHMNSFPRHSCKGAQAFYKKGSEIGGNLAQCVQNELFSSIQNAKKTALVGDYYIVNCTDLPAVLVECGFLSNEEEEKLLQQTDHQNKVCYAICCGILKFLDDH